MNAAKYFVFLAHGVGIASLRAITGVEEQSLETNNSLTAIELINQLLVDTPLASVKPGSVMDVPISERDKLLASIYIDLFGADIENTITCDVCAEQFELNFSLDDIQKSLISLQQTAQEQLGKRLSLNDDHSYTLDAESDSEVTFRLPNGQDELRLLNELASDATPRLVENCILKKSKDTDCDELETVVEKLAPMIDVELNAACPECQNNHHFDFNLQDYLLAKLQGERQSLQHQIHALATNYNWSLSQILSLTRRDRLSLYQLTQAEGVRV